MDLPFFGGVPSPESLGFQTLALNTVLCSNYQHLADDSRRDCTQSFIECAIRRDCAQSRHRPSKR